MNRFIFTPVIYWYDKTMDSDTINCEQQEHCMDTDIEPVIVCLKGSVRQ